MIEKLKTLEDDEMDMSVGAVNTRFADTELVRKINELCDIINTIQKEREAERFEIREWIGILEAVRKSVNIHEKQIDELQMKVDVLFSRFDVISLALEKKNTRPHKEQQDWLGHIVEYGNADDGFKYGILTNIDDTFSAFPYEIDNGRDATADCWLPDDSLFYKREEK